MAPGFKYNMSDIQAALGLAQLRKLEGFQRRRREVVAAYDCALSAGARAGGCRSSAPDVDHAWHLYVLRLRPEALRIGRDEFIDELTARNIGTSVHFIPMHLHPYYRKRYAMRPARSRSREGNTAGCSVCPSIPASPTRTSADVIEAVLDVVKRFAR